MELQWFEISIFSKSNKNLLKGTAKAKEQKGRLNHRKLTQFIINNTFSTSQNQTRVLYKFDTHQTNSTIKDVPSPAQ